VLLPILLYPLFLLTPPPTPATSTFPYTTLFRSCGHGHHGASGLRRGADRHGHVRQRRRAGWKGRSAELPDRRGGRRPRLLLQLRSEEHTSELQSRVDLVCRLLLEKKKNQ